MRRETLLLMGTLVGFLGVGCQAQEPTSPAWLPTPRPKTPSSLETATPLPLFPTETATDEPTPIQAQLFPTTIPTPLVPQSADFGNETVDHDRPKARPKYWHEATPRAELVPAVLPNDIIGKFITVAQTTLVNGQVVPKDTTVAVIFKQDGTRLYLDVKTAEVYRQRGAVIPHWLSPDGRLKYLVSDDGRSVFGGPLTAPESTYMLIRHFDHKKGGFTGVPAVNADGYIVTTKHHDTLDIGEGSYWESDGTHHGGTFWKAPIDWKISDLAFGVHNHKGDLLLVMKDSLGNQALYWLLRAIPEFSQRETLDCGASTHRLTYCMMETIRDEGGRRRSPDQQMLLTKVDGSSDVFDAAVIWNAYP